MITKEILAKLKLDSKDFRNGLGQTEKDVLKFSASIIAVGTAVAFATKATADYRDETVKAARSAGATTEEFSALRYAADLSGVSMEQLGKALKQLNAPALKTQETWAKWGVSITDSSGKTKTQSELLENIADKIKSVESPAKKSAIAMDFFGAKGAGMVNLLSGGSAELKKMTDEAARMGLVFDDEAGAASEKFNDDIERITASIKGLTQQTTGSIIEFINQSGVFTIVAESIQKVTGAWMSLDSETKKTILTVGAVSLAIAGLGVALIGIIHLAPIVGSALLSAFPIALLVTGIIALGVVTYKYFDQIKSALTPIQDAFEDVKNIIYDTYLTMKSAFSGLKETFQPLISGISEISNTTNDSGKSISMLGTIARGIFGMISAVVMVSVTPFKILYELISGNIEIMSKLGEAVSLAFSGKFKEAGDVAEGALERTKYMGEQLKNNFIEAGSAIKNAMTIKPVFETADIEKKLDGVKKKIDSTIAPENAPEIAIFIGITTKNKVSEEIKAMAGEFQATSNRFSEISQVIGNTWGKMTELMAQKMQQSLARVNRNFEVFSGKYAQMADKIKEETENSENEKIKMLESKYDEQINQLQMLEDRKLATISNASRERLLALDQEYINEKERQELAFESWMEGEAVRYEAEKELILQKSIDKEQTQLVESIMDNDFKLYMEMKQKEHDLKMDNFSKEYLAKQKNIDAEEKNSAVLTQTEIKNQVTALNLEKNKALEQAEAEKNDRMTALEKKRYEDEKSIKKMEALTNYRAEKSQLENTKALKITQTVIGGLAGAAGAFAMAASTIPIVGIIIGAALAAGVLIATGISVAQISSQTVPAPAALFLAEGGVLSGASHAGGGISANLEGGEGVIDKIRTQKLINAVDGSAGGVSYNFYFEDGAIRNDGKDIDETTMEKLSYMLARMFERQGIYA